MLCLPIETLKENYQKLVAAVLVLGLSVFGYYTLSELLTAMTINNVADGLRMMQLLLAVSIAFFDLLLLFGSIDYFAYQKLQEDELLVQEFCRQRDFDMLSGLKNRNSYIRFVEEVENQGDQVSVMMCDIDELKIINDTLGHIAGDQIIKKAAGILRKVCPESAHIFRIGGDEYIVVISDALPAEQMEKLRLAIRKELADYNADQEQIPLSMSIGFAVSSLTLEGFWAVAKQADHNMYQEKRVRKDKVYRNLREALTE